MRHTTFIGLTALVAAALLPRPLPGQTALTVTPARFATLRWLEGRWEGHAANGASFFEGYRFADDSTIRTYSYADSIAATPDDSDDVALRGGRVRSGSGKASWVLTALGPDSARFDPVRGAANRFVWRRLSADRWTATLDWPAVEGRPARQTVYEMRRIGASAIAPAGAPGLSLSGADSAWARAYARQDTALGLALLDPDVFITATAGTTRGRAGEIGDMRPAPGMTMHFFRTRDVRTRTYGETGVVTGLAEWEFENAGRVSALRRRYTAVYVRGGPVGWRMVTLHIGRAPEGG